MSLLVNQLRAQTPQMLVVLEALVNQESPSSDIHLLDACASLVERSIEKILGSSPTLRRLDGKPHVLWSRGEPRVLLLGHFDTVWPRGTVDRWPFRAQGTHATGPGVFDMKAGIVQALFALEALRAPAGVALLLTSDEEVGSEASQDLIVEIGRKVDAALVLEPALDGALKVARKGYGTYTVTIEGVAAHASQPELGANAAIEMANVVLQAALFADPLRGTTCTPTLATAGTAANTIPHIATLTIDSRAVTQDEQRRIDGALRALRPSVPGTQISIVGGPKRAPMPEMITRDLFQRAQYLALELGLPAIKGAHAPGGSDGQLTAAEGTPTLDGLGAVGANAHAEGEYVEILAMAERAALVAALTKELLGL